MLRHFPSNTGDHHSIIRALRSEAAAQLLEGYARFRSRVFHLHDRHESSLRSASSRPLAPCPWSRRQIDGANRARDCLMGERATLINQLRPFLFERGIIITKSRGKCTNGFRTNCRRPPIYVDACKSLSLTWLSNCSGAKRLLSMIKLRVSALFHLSEADLARAKTVPIPGWSKHVYFISIPPFSNACFPFLVHITRACSPCSLWSLSAIQSSAP